jgi:hypothetical protein
MMLNRSIRWGLFGTISECCLLLLVGASLSATGSSFMTPSSKNSVHTRRTTISILSSIHKPSRTPLSSENPFYMSDIPRDDGPDDLPPDVIPPPSSEKGRPPRNEPLLKFFHQPERWWMEDFLPPPTEDQFIMTGDIFVLFFYAFTSHSINDAIVESVLRKSESVQKAIHSLDPTGEIVSMQNPVWVQTQNQVAVDHALAVTAQEAFLNHWGPLFSTEGSACVALCTCWLLAGWFHRAFLFRNSVHCRTDVALQKTLETWFTTAALMCMLAAGTDAIVQHVPFLQTLLCVACREGGSMGGSGIGSTSSFLLSLTKADAMFIVDSLSVLVAWRFMANRILNTFR